MRARRAAGLVARNLRRNLRYHLLAGAGIVVGVAAFSFFLALGEGVRKRVVAPLSAALPPAELQVVPETFSLGPLQFDRPRFLSGQAFDESALNELGQIPEVRSVHGTMNVLFPVMASGRFFDESVQTDLILTGIDEELVGAELGDDSFSHREGEPLPVVVSPHLLELYNASFAKMNDLPQVTDELLLGIRFRLVLGRSYLAGAPDPSKVRTVPCRVVGLSRYAVLVGASVPLSFVQTANREFAGAEAGRTYKSAFVVAESSAAAERVARAVEEQGHKVESEARELAQTIEAAVTGVTALLSLVGVTVIVVAAVVMALTFSLTLLDRRQELGLLRALGATRADLRALIVAEASVVALVGALVGLSAGRLAASGCDILAALRLPDFPYKPESFFAFPAWLLAASLALAVLCCVVGAMVPARKATRLDPAEVLSSR